MKILVIHDREEARTSIIEVCKKTVGKDASIDAAEDYVNAVKFLSENAYDLAILDLTLPHVAAKGSASFDIASNLLYEILHTDKLFTPGDIIGITCDKDAFQKLGKESGAQLMAVVEEDADEKWKSILADRIKYIGRSYFSRLNSFVRHFDYDVCLITALDKELAPYKDIFELRPERNSSDCHQFFFKDRNGKTRKGVACSIGRAGISRAATKVQQLSISYRPKLIVMSGFCGGVKDKIKLGDIAVFETVFDWDSGKWKSVDDAVSFVARPEPIGIRDTELHIFLREFEAEGLPELSHHIEVAKRLSPGFDSIKGKVELVSAASGSSVIADDSVVRKIQGLSEAISAVDMESYAIYLARKSNLLRQPNVLCIKAVSDYCDGNKQDGLHAACSYLSARSVQSLLLRTIDFEKLD